MEHTMPVYDGGLKIICPEDCGNAPKKEMLRDFNIAFAKQDADTLLQQVTDDILWNRVGDGVIRGKASFAEALYEMKGSDATELHISHIITHGKTGAANGTLRFGETGYAFCDIYVFNSAAKHAKIKEITSYVIEISSEPIR